MANTHYQPLDSFITGHKAKTHSEADWEHDVQRRAHETAHKGYVWTTTNMLNETSDGYMVLEDNVSILMNG